VDVNIVRRLASGDSEVSTPGVKIVKSVDRANRPPCENCEVEMWLITIKSAERGLELRHYECARCAAGQTVMVQTKALEPATDHDALSIAPK